MKKFNYSKQSIEVLQKGNILWKNELPEDMITRIITSTAKIEIDYFNQDPAALRHFLSSLEDYLITKKIVPSTPILTNLWRVNGYPMSACIVPDIDFTHNKKNIKAIIDSLHLEGMGTGFNFSELQEPHKIIYFLNDIANELQNSWKQNRPVGNMGIMNIYDKNIENFIDLKIEWINKKIDWKFNFSIDIDNAFIDSLSNNKNIILTNGVSISARKLFKKICFSAYECGDPGIVRLDLMNKDNPLESISKYIATAPCGEVGLAAWETCQFSSINISECVKSSYNGKIEINYELLKNITHLLVRFLDDMLEHSIKNYSQSRVREIAIMKRKIWIWVCGFADFLIKMNLPYESPEAIQKAEEIMSFINLESKKASIELAKTRGAFPKIQNSKLINSLFYSERFWESNNNWQKIDSNIQKFWIRNSSTTALPPTWRSSIIFDTSQQIEPIFHLRDNNWEIRADLDKCLKNTYQGVYFNDVIEVIANTWSCQWVDFLQKEIYKTSKEISSLGHINMLLAFQKYTDEAISKTINLPNNSTLEEIMDIYNQAFEKKLKWITIYRDSSREFQPIKL
jgi:ribonucleoside-diphosphate reductase alpha chain